MFINYYDILGVSNTATTEQIKKAYRVKAVKYHPDKHFGDPYFVQKFIEIKDAYDILIDFEKRNNYDKEYSTFYKETIVEPRQEKFKESKHQEKQEEEKFRYDPYKPFYSPYDREQQDTPQFAPKITPWGESAVGFIFFKLPQKIGKIIGGYSTAIEGEKIDTFFKYVLFNFKKSISSAVFALIISGVLLAIWSSNKIERAGIYAASIFAVLYLLSLLVSLFKNKYIFLFNHSNYYVGINGFAIYKCQKTIDNIVYDLEVNFNDITDLAVEEALEYHDSPSTENHILYKACWFNTKNKKVIHEFKKSFAISKRNPKKSGNYEYHFYEEAEKWKIRSNCSPSAR